MKKKHEIAIGNEYRRTLGCVKQNVTVVGYDAETDKFKPFIIATKNGKRFTTDEKTIAKWELTKAVKANIEKKAEVSVEKRKNEITCLEAAIRTLIKHNVPMNAKQLVNAMKEDGIFHFKDTAKTPWNSVGTRIATYVNNCIADAVECRIKAVSRGVYAHADYEPAEA